MKAEIDKLAREIRQAEQSPPSSDVQVARLFNLVGMDPQSQATRKRAVLASWAVSLPERQDRDHAKTQLDALGGA